MSFGTGYPVFTQQPQSQRPRLPKNGNSGQVIFYLVTGALIVSAVVGVLVCNAAAEHDANEEAQSQARKRSVTPGTAEHEQRQKVERAAATKRAEASTPRMSLPKHPLPHEVIGLTRAEALKALGGTAKSDGDDTVLALKGAEIRIGYSDGRASSYTITPEHFLKKRDEGSLRFDLELSRSKMNGMPVEFVVTDSGAIVRDATKALAAEADLNAKRRVTFAGFIEGNMRADGWAVTVTARGKENKVLRIRWNGCDEPQLDTFVNGPLFERNKYEFTRVDCDDGVQTWSVTY